MTNLRHSALLLGALMLTSGPLHAATYDLCVGETTTLVAPGDGGPAIPIAMWGYGIDAGPGTACNATVPGPQLDVTVGDLSLTVNLRNTLSGHATSIMVPGQGLPDIGGTPVTFTDAQGRSRIRSFVAETAPGSSGSYSWNNIRPGTYGYQSGTHIAVQVQMGLYGAMVKDNAVGEAYPGISYDQDQVLLYSAIDPELHRQVSLGLYGDPSDPNNMTSTVHYAPEYFLVNGQSYAVGDLPTLIGAPGTTTLLRMINMDIDTHAPMLLGSHLDIIAESGYPYPFPRQQYSVNLAPGQAKDALLTATDAVLGDTLALIDRRLNTTNAGGSGGGLVSLLQVGGDPVVNTPGYYFVFYRGFGNTIPAALKGVTALPNLVDELGAPLATIENRDVVKYDPQANQFQRVFDGSTFGLMHANNPALMASIDALHVYPDGRMLMSFRNTTTIPGLLPGNQVSNSDLVLYDASQANPFSVVYSAAALQITGNIDALAVDTNGDLLVSTAWVNSFGGDEDVLRYSQASQSWSVEFDGTALDASFKPKQADIDALDVPAVNQLQISTLGRNMPLVQLPDVRDEDILLYNATSLPALTTQFDMSALIEAAAANPAYQLPFYVDINAMSH